MEEWERHAAGNEADREEAQWPNPVLVLLALLGYVGLPLFGEWVLWQVMRLAIRVYAA